MHFGWSRELNLREKSTNLARRDLARFLLHTKNSFSQGI
jgi:hypothetical protein